MTTIRRFEANDLFNFTDVNLDHLTETYHNGFYLQYLAIWPDMCALGESINKDIMGYIFGKSEGEGKMWHGHVTAVTVSPEYRRLGLARQLMQLLEGVSENIANAYFVDLYVRSSNNVAIRMYQNFGYIVFRRVLGYYSGEEDGLDMRKSLARDAEKKSMIPLGRDVTDEDDYG
ncbi:n-alpha-acetyltransferase 20 [Anaeramoeba ignava]|uniref:N-alpha-acetyltransferase 20 n=1 Tax=Anaeramoeba ignava TaxID=1746090 RepID=A0A9Q0LX32_ANAIG|nr:n-alpha-acetyltransferase 20 [Anaeramoeba ignava]